MSRRLPRDSAAFGRQTGKPLVIAATQRSVADRFASEGLSVFPTETEAVSALHQFLAHRELMARTLARKARRVTAGPPVLSAATTMLNEADSLALLAARGIPVVPHRLCRSRAEAVAAFEAIGGPVVVKGCSADIAHKSELGLVKLGVKTREEAGEVWAQMEAIIRKHGARFRRRHHRGDGRGPARNHDRRASRCRVRAGGSGRRRRQICRDFPRTPRCCCRHSRTTMPGRRSADCESRRYSPAYAANHRWILIRCAIAVVRIGALMLDPAAKVMSLDLNPVLLDTAGKGCVVVDAVVFQG